MNAAANKKMMERGAFSLGNPATSDSGQTIRVPIATRSPASGGLHRRQQSAGAPAGFLGNRLSTPATFPKLQAPGPLPKVIESTAVIEGASAAANAIAPCMGRGSLC
jgi:hypothetical protein